jgi:hypothetical protein
MAIVGDAARGTIAAAVSATASRQDRFIFVSFLYSVRLQQGHAI